MCARVSIVVYRGRAADRGFRTRGGGLPQMMTWFCAQHVAEYFVYLFITLMTYSSNRRTELTLLQLRSKFGANASDA